jgi:hypothetical protein
MARDVAPRNGRPQAGKSATGGASTDAAFSSRPAQAVFSSDHRVNRTVRFGRDGGSSQALPPPTFGWACSSSSAMVGRGRE